MDSHGSRLAGSHPECHAVLLGTHWNSTESPDLLTRLAAAWSVLTDADRLAVVELAERLARAIRNGLAVSG